MLFKIKINFKFYLPKILQLYESAEINKIKVKLLNEIQE